MATQNPHKDIKAMRRARVKEIALLPAGANPPAHVLFFKADPEAYLKRTFSAEQRRRLAASGQAMRDGSFPIANVSDLRNAIHAVGRASNPAAARRHIIRRARALGRTDLLPESWGVKAVKKGHVRKDAVSFDEVRQGRLALAAVNEISRRVGMLFEAVESIIHDDEGDREAAIRESMDQFVESVQQDLPDILSGRMAKSAPTRKDLAGLLQLRDAVDGWLAGSDSMKKITVKFDKAKVGPEAAARIESMLAVDVEGWDPAAVDAYTKSVEGAIAHAEGTAVAYAKALELRDAPAKPAEDPETAFTKALKDLPEPMRKHILDGEAERKQLHKQVDDLQKARRHDALVAMAKEIGPVPGFTEDQVAAHLERADALGAEFLKSAEEFFKGAAEMRTMSEALKALGYDAAGSPSDDEKPASDLAKTLARDMRKAKPELTEDQALAQVWEKNPTLYRRFIRESSVPRLNA